ncbi:MAG: gamma-glutamylcyclotransferase [Candidatus Competibacteraceae bacterium]|nr:gamma-glutamylcyclotransferase [Candidatus Competibacteraceae bacterium]
MKDYGHPLPHLPQGDLWVFGYGSLMWRPGFAHLEALPARLMGYHRALCVWSWHHRGSPQCPGLVFGLDRGGSCRGRALRVAAAERKQVAEYLYERELVTPVYVPRLLPVRLAQGTVTALTFTIDRRHPQYAGRLDPAVAAAVVSASHGHSGPNREYLLNTLAHLQDLGIDDPKLAQVARLVKVSP